MSGRGIPLTAINGGMNRLRVKGAARKDTLYQLTNAYVTAGNTIKPRGGTIRNANLATLATAGSTKGLVAHQGALHVFSAQKVNVPAGYVDHVLSHPAVQQSYTPPFPSPDAHYTARVVQSLLHFEDGNGSTTFADVGTAAPVWTSVGGAACSTVQAKFGTGSLLVNSTTKYITTPVAAGGALDLQTGQPDWTVEFWAYPSDLTNVCVLADLTCGLATLFRVYTNGTTVTVQTFGGGVGWAGAGPSGVGTMVLNQWNHVAVCRDGNVLRLYTNGTPVGTANIFTSIGTAIPGASTYKLGGSSSNFGTIETLYVDDFRITVGACLYGGPFSAPAATLTTTADIPYTTSSLLHFDDGANSTAFADQVSTTTWTAAGAAKEVTAPVKLGTGAGAFLVNADYIKTTRTAKDAMDITEGYCDFTIEGFIYPTDISSGLQRTWLDFAHKNAGSVTSDTLFYLYSQNQTLHFVDTQGNSFTTGNVLTAANTWYHVALVRYGCTLTLFVNGVSVGSASGSSTYVAMTTGGFYLMGAQWTGASGTSATGYVDEFRVLKGLAAYISGFTPPVAPYTAPGYTPIALLDIHFAAPFMGFLYVVAEFVSDGGSGLGTVFHYWLQTSGKWLANTLYQVGQIISPNVDNGLTYRAERFGAPNPAWAASTLKAVNDKVEPTVPNGFLYTATVVDGGNPITGTTEPTWPIVDGGVVYEESEKTGTGEVATPAPQPALTTPSPGTGGRYINPYRTTVIG